VQADAVGDRVEIRVIDQGPGVPDEVREQIFQPFQRRGDTGGGLGLGLAIARGFAEAMDGELTVEDTPGGGATFVFSLPRFAAGAPPVPRRRGLAAEPSAGSAAAGSPPALPRAEHPVRDPGA
jgi:two-component system, OmpR family, sensor histidine kinase KdpD